ncbi:MAG: serpin family protein [Cyclobacteriaceae bacterium]|nr:serpin family protein [Cyclobacteriaceae bacterium]
MKNLFKIFAPVMAIAVTLFGCGDRADNLDNLPNLRPLSAGEVQVIEASNEFSMDLLQVINRDHLDENIFISPFSVSAALSMTANGARGETRDAIKTVLHATHLSDAEMNAAYRDLVKFLLDLDRKVELQIANSSWYRNDLTIHSDFSDILSKYYDAEIRPSDFGDPATVGKINGWIDTKTRGKIKNMLDQIPSDAVMFLINAIYFKADWQVRFDEARTEKAPFYAPGGEKMVDMMYAKGSKISLFQHPDFVLADIPYGNGQFSMTLLIQREGKDINEIIDTMTREQLGFYINQSDTTTMEVYMPKFKMEFRKGLVEALSSLGMGIAFTDDADLSGIFREDLRLLISRILHQSFIEVNEKGSEAAAATIIEVGVTSMPVIPPGLRADRPFAFFIREKHSNTILFSGKMLDPTKGD